MKPTYHVLPRSRWALFSGVVLCAAALYLASPASAQSSASSTRVLQGSAVTESNVLDALTPSEEAITLRSLRVSRDTPGTQAAAAVEKKPSASLLITFETASADLLPQAKRQLDIVASALAHDQLREYSFVVEGHADPRGNPDANRLLSQSRAESVRNYLIYTHGIAAERLKAVGRGDTEVMNTANVAAPENRRVTIVTNLD